MDENIDDLKKRIEELRRENARLQHERDIARSDVQKLLPKATPEQEEELRQQMAEPRLNAEQVFARIIAELEAADGN